MKHLTILLFISLMATACQYGKKKQPTKEKCDTCPSLSNEGKIDKPFKKKKR
jgi:hypothetical protein